MENGGFPLVPEAIQLAAWKLGPKVYEITIDDPAVQFESMTKTDDSPARA